MLFNDYGLFLRLSLICKLSLIAYATIIFFFFPSFSFFNILKISCLRRLYDDIFASRAWDMRTMESLCRACKYAVSKLNN